MIWLTKRKILFFNKYLFLFLIFIIAGCSTLQKDWDNAQQTNTTGGFHKFLSEHPRSQFSRVAKSKVEKLKWNEAQILNTEEAYRTFLSSYPRSKFVQSAKDRIEKLKWEGTQKLNTEEAYLSFLSVYPKSTFLQAAKGHIEKFEWDAAVKLNTTDAYSKFLSAYPKSEFAHLAKAKMHNLVNELEQQFKICKTAACSDQAFSLWEKAFWESAKQIENRDRYAKYLLLFPTGKYVSLANKAIDDIDWRACKEGRSTEVCEKYLAVQKSGKHRQEAKGIIADNEFMGVKEENTISACEKFLKSHRYHEGALALYRQLLYATAVKTGKLEDWETFYSKSKVASYKRKKWDKPSQVTYEQMMENAKTQIERLLYEKAIAYPSLEDYRAYLKEFPNGVHKQQIIVLMEPLFFKEARSVNTVKLYNKYLKQYPTGFSSENARALLDPVLWEQMKTKNDRVSYKNYIKKFPAGSYVKDAENKIKWMESNPAIPKISFPKSIFGSGSNPTFRWVTKFSEQSGKAGYTVSGSGWVRNSKGSRYGPSGRRGSRGTITVKAGGTAKDDHWVRGKTFCGGWVEYDWVGKDTNGHKVNLKERIILMCQ